MQRPASSHRSQAPVRWRSGLRAAKRLCRRKLRRRPRGPWKGRTAAWPRRVRRVGGMGSTTSSTSARSSPPRPPSSPEEASAALAAAEDAGFEALLTEHRATWAHRWEGADVVVDGDADLTRATRFALFTSMASVRDHGEAAVGARGLTGPGYRGHVF
jgi:hypothetical protein